MAASDRRLRIFLTVPAFLSLVKTKARQGLALATALLIAMPGFAQQPSQATPLPDSPDSSQTAVVANKTTVAVPAGTRIALVLTHPLQSRYVHRGDDIYAQTTSPVVAGDHVVIPPGTFVQGKVDELERKGRRGELHLQSMQITFPDGYVAPLSGPVTLVSDDGYAIRDPGKGRIAGMFAAPAAGLGLGALIGRAAHTTQSSTLGGMTITSHSLSGVAIGSIVGLAIGGAVSLVLLTSSHNFFLDVGSPVEMVLHQPLSLEQDQVSDAVRQSEQHPVPTQPIAQRPQPLPPSLNSDPGICYTPGTPGTPDTDIPGTPAVGDSLGTPSIHIPGIPATPPTPHPCP